ncbi:hypothetical protein ATY41_05045 [Leifsonia xyli subsp. xyli]|uniref:DUF4282 domain-containing protein n=2 Tax=Leifsonia xyli subsp. xyli TaxID=59736 RepID=Q6AFU7_LEIXX|nr:DUF4282 domain-containing protein [Leifsonia xyli]AAT88748.1 hypothetical protein Lxx08510 [Leifsonia xyli subsp. xyli str. CTCB07]ODA89464.1 hypothetical protein ATY41_05045 [Leifsonia xyli subsp. xyli]
MSTPQPPSDDDHQPSPATDAAEADETVTPAPEKHTAGTPDKEPAAKAGAPAGKPAAVVPAKRTPAPRKRPPRTTPSEKARNTDGEAPEILDAMLATAAPPADSTAVAGTATAAEDRSAASETAVFTADAPGLPSGAGAARADPPQAAPGQPGYGRTVNDFAERLDDSRFFSSLFDFTFTSYVTRKLAGPVYVVGLMLIGLGIVVGFANSLGIAIATSSPVGAFVFLLGVLVTLVAAVLSVLLLRVTIEVFCAIIEIAQNTRPRHRPPRE